MPLNIRIVREAGGLGDSLRILPVLREIVRRYPEDNIWLYVPGPYLCVYQHSGVPFSHVLTPFGRARRPRLAPLDSIKWPYLKAPQGVEKWDIEIDEYCPGFRYEIDVGYEVKKNRIQLFLEAARLWPCDPLPRYYTTPKEDQTALSFLMKHDLKKHKLIAIQPFSTDKGRDWPEEHWMSLANSLQYMGYTVIVLDCCLGRVRRFRQLQVTRLSIPQVAAVLRYCDLLVCPDSGLYHLAAAVNTPALGLFASQPGRVMKQFYPLHYYIEPDREKVIAPCRRWPCIWKRLPECRPHAAKETCRVLRQLSVREVLRRILRILHYKG